MNKIQTIQHIYKLVQKSNYIFVQGHGGCGDAIGSTLAMVHWLERIGKKYIAFSPEPIPEMFQFLPGVEKITADKNSFNIKDFDLLLILDCGDIGRTGIAEKIKAEKLTQTVLVNIDHHHTNDDFGDVNFVDKNSPSTTVLVHEFFQINNISINKNIATCLLNGIFTDTGIFINPATNQEALGKASDLLLAGASLYTILNSILKNKTVLGLKLWGRALMRLQYNERYKLAYTVLLEKDFRELGISGEEGTEGLSNFMNNLNDAKITLILREENGKIKGSFRTTDDQFDVAKLAGLFGGGGHKKAAGFTIPGQLFFDTTQNIWKIV